MAKKILIALVALVVVLGAVISMQPDSYRVERSANIEAPADVVFAHAADLRKFNEWSPWSEFDPNMKMTYSEKTSGVGASYEWQGNDQVGHGKMTITESQAPTSYKIDLEFFAPMNGTAIGGMDIEPNGDSSKITWWVEGKNDFGAKAFGLVMDMDKMIGDTYAKGLANLNEVAKKDAAERARLAAEAKAKAEAEALAAAEAAKAEASK